MYKKAEALLVNLGPDDRGGRRGAGRPGQLPVEFRLATRQHGPQRRSAVGLPPGAWGSGNTGRRPQGDGRVPAGTRGHDLQGRLSAEARRASHRKRRPSSARRWRSGRSWPTTISPSPTSAATWPAASSISASLLLEMGKPSEAEAECRKALAIRQKLADENAAVTQFQSNLAASHHNLGHRCCRVLGKTSEAEAELRKALAIEQKLADDQSRRHRIPHVPGEPPRQPRQPAAQTGKSSEAEAEYRKALTIRSEARRRRPHGHRVPQHPGAHPRRPRPPTGG